ncbi:hypothetical protein [Curtobacterium ammoniigenes]|uniref:hypothetical protein n=1 Tax=Curtobacterium ammoniigenes TaxID=395387 RepID=UPI00082BEB56|nr:hypothetical protein [Curtobacterium ammoniigenes]
MNAFAREQFIDLCDEPFWGLLDKDEVETNTTNLTRIDAAHTRRWLQRTHDTGILDLLAQWRAEDRAGHYRGGRPPAFGDDVILTLSLMLVAENASLKIANYAAMLQFRLTDEAREVLGITHLYDGRKRNWALLALRALRRLIDTFDGWPDTPHRKAADLAERERIQLAREADADRIAVKEARGRRFTTTFLAWTLTLLPKHLQKTSVALTVDQTDFYAGTVLSSWGKEHGVEQPKYFEDTNEEVTRRVLELEAGLYPKKKGAKVKDPNEAAVFVPSEWHMAFMGNVIVGVHEDPTEDNSLEPPQLIYAASLGTPNDRVGFHTIALIDLILERNLRITRLSFDRGYSNLVPENFHRPLRERGIPVIKDYMQKGITNGIGGAVMVEGDYYCPATSTEHLEATPLWDAGTITVKEYIRDIGNRQAFKLHVKDVRPERQSSRMRCPALGPSATVRCALRQPHPKAAAKDDLPMVYKSRIPKRPPLVCCQDSITIPDTDNEKLRGQLYPYGTVKHTSVYRADRASSESINDAIANNFTISTSPNRPMRGLAANQFAWTMLVVATNLKKIVDHAHATAPREELAEVIELNPRHPRDAQGTPLRRNPPAPKNVGQRLRDREGRSDYKRNPVKRKKVLGPTRTREDVLRGN